MADRNHGGPFRNAPSRIASVHDGLAVKLNTSRLRHEQHGDTDTTVSGITVKVTAKIENLGDCKEHLRAVGHLLARHRRVVGREA